MKPILFFLLIISISSCELNPPVPECITPRSLNKLDFESSQYKSITSSYLSNSQPSEYRYFFKTFHEKNGKSYMTTNFRNTSVCFDIDIQVDNWEKLAGMKQKNGVSYPKELVNLKWSLEKIGNDTIVIYKDMNWIRD